MDLEQHLEDRNLHTDLYNGIMKFDDEGIVIFPLWNLSGQFVGYQQYRPNATKERRNDPREGRYYTSLHGDKDEKPLAVWGLESLDFEPSVLVITEGIFDACQFHRYHVPAVALLNSSYKHFKNWLTCTGRKIYKVEDDHGSKLGPYAQLRLPDGRSDVGECDSQEVFKMIMQMVDDRPNDHEKIEWVRNRALPAIHREMGKLSLIQSMSPSGLCPEVVNYTPSKSIEHVTIKGALDL